MTKAVLAPAVAVFILMQTSPCLPEAAFAFGQYGTGAWAAGYGYNYATTAEAEAAAMKNCNSRGSNCEVRTTFSGLCFAYAVQDNDNGYGWTTDQNVNTASRNALARCTSYGSACSIKETFCDGGTATESRPAPRAAPAPPPQPPPRAGGGTPCERFPNLC